MNNKIKNYLFLILVAGGLIALDQWSKWYVRTSLSMGAIWSPWEWLEPYARIVHWQNTGVAFGMFQGMNKVFAILAAVVSVVIIYYYPQVAGDNWVLKTALSLQLAGAMGNLIDRLVVGYVTDFISFGTFPVFNLADASISVGVIVLLLYVWLQERKEKAKVEQEKIGSGEPVNETIPRED